MPTTTKEYWLNKWQTGDTAFHEGKVNIHFADFAYDVLRSLKKPARLLFPLCGKTVDMLEGLALGHHVVGIDICEKALRDFLSENGLRLNTLEKKANTTIFRGDHLELHWGDIFQIDPITLNIDFIFDRAALVALPQEDRQLYAAFLGAALKPGGTMILVTHSYLQEDVGGPPYSISHEEIVSLFSDSFTLENLLTKEAIDDYPFLREKGLSSFKSSVYLLIKKSLTANNII